MLYENVRICSSAVILGDGALIVGKGAWIGHEAMIVTGSRVEIGPNVDIGPRVYIGTGTHEKGTETRAAGRGLHKDVVICSGAWIGISAIVLPGVVVGARCIVGAGAVVTRSTAVGSMVVGNPAEEATLTLPPMPLDRTKATETSA